MIAVALNKPETRVDRESRFVIRSDLEIGPRSTTLPSGREERLRQTPSKTAPALARPRDHVENPDKPVLNNRHTPGCRSSLINERGVKCYARNSIKDEALRHG